MMDLVISKGSLKQGQLTGKTVLLTGGGGGIGLETARALIWLGAKVVIAEIDRKSGEAAEKALSAEFGAGKAFFIETDISNEKSVERLCRQAGQKVGCVDVIFNNATIAPIGAAHTVGVNKWDKSYGVNLRGPVLLLERLLPAMLIRKSGIIVFVPSSGAAPYMGAYEVFKTAQVELCNTLAGELESSGVLTFSIGPGIVKTDTASRAIEQIAPLHGKSVAEFFEMNKAVLISPEEAGAGFAAAVALAERYNGAETSSLQALADAGISIAEDAQK
jgi:NAD(P)-dependent dehydrogenase (short-subunit alcohol dehydrogenase family)